MAKETANAAVVLTPRPAAHGGAAIAVVRIRGPKVADFLRRFFSRPAQSGRCVHGQLGDGSQTIDDPVILLSPDESWADICLHGGPWIVTAVFDLARREGFEIVSGAQLPLPEAAVDPDLPMLEREMLAHLPLARTEPAVRILLEQPAIWRAAKPEELDLRAIVEDQTLWRLLHAPQVAIVGEPNVGKSTLANRLFGRERSITADVPGTTRDWVGEIADIDGLAVMLVDTPGQRATDDEIESAAISASGEKIRDSDLVLRVLDATRDYPPPLVLRTSASSVEPGRAEVGVERNKTTEGKPPPQSSPGEEERRSLLIINKIDQPPGWDFAALNAARISVRTGVGMRELAAEIHAYFGVNLSGEPRPHWWTQRQREVLMRAIENPSAMHEVEI